MTNARVNEEINQSVAELYDKLTAVIPETYQETNNISIVSGTNAYALPSDYLRTLAVDVVRSDGTYAALEPYQLAERNYDNDVGGVTREYTKYRIRGSNITFAPTPNWTETNSVVHLYIPTPDVLTNDADTFDGIVGYEDYVVFDVLIKVIGGKEEGDASQFERLLAKVNDRITTLAQPRDKNAPAKIRNMDEERAQRIWPKYSPS